MADPLKAYLASLPEYSSARAQFLYSSLSARKAANPTGYAGALSWWRLTLSSLVSKGLLGDDKLILVAEEDLKEKLRWDKIGRPLSLGTVISELAQSKDYVPLETFLASGSATKGSSWLSLLARPLWWGVSRVFGSSEGGEGADEAEWTARKGDWVVKELVERAAAGLIPKLSDLHADAISRLYTIKTFQSKLGALCLPDVVLSERDCSVLAKHLSLKGICIVQGEVIKFAAPVTTSPIALTITESDRGILTLLNTLSSLDTYITSIEARIATEQAQAVSYNAKKQLTLVKSHLVARKRLEALLAQRVASRDKLSEVLHGIEKAVGDEETMSALSLGTSTLRSILASPNLSLDHIEETTTALSDTLADANDISEAVSAVGQLDSDLEGEVEDELKSLVESVEREERAEKERERVEKEQREREERDKERAREIEREQRESERVALEREKLEAEEKQRVVEEKERVRVQEDQEKKRLAEEETRREEEVAEALKRSEAPSGEVEEKEQRTAVPAE
ncbi:hypothetical protein BCR35DRAFT_284434 [Leucosporidium creatinivorum]|uniref:Snf7-domain-containing protein n=1 Tax=Leucosporidium creatinivorum TaxID=106004 RepID=A0A1Y2D7U1_9BASI|nr:hypothetical protein BCR35DRAFT_284434 [Leucosporidium creatinivorum]